MDIGVEGFIIPEPLFHKGCIFDVRFGEAFRHKCWGIYCLGISPNYWQFGEGVKTYFTNKAILYQDIAV